ncbi:hypothetical protein NIES4071_106750 (plasmid) [Calothrix sp. NIES-4071]|nr:hypothetical protein NIES4071_106750 [Calothrix sp. NIES-4071]BAZ65093.1 hypothetical protein NIES4105_108260 [Calothrix sp. NIES-4105]
MTKQCKYYQSIITIMLILSYQPQAIAQIDQIPRMPQITINPPTLIITVKGSRRKFKNKLRRIPFTNYVFPSIKINDDTYVLYENGIRSNRIRSNRTR